MELTDNDLIIIEKYKNGLLSDIEKKALQQRMQTDAEFKKEVYQLTGALSALETLRQMESVQYLREIAAVTPVIKPVSSGISYWKVLAAIILLIVGGLFIQKFLIKVEENVPTPIIAALYEPYPELNETKGNETANMKSSALTLYRNGAYRQAAPLLEDVFNDTQDSIMLFYQGVALLGYGEDVKALSIFEKLQNSTKVPIEAVQYYLALSYITQQQSEKATPILKEIANNGQRFREKAKIYFKQAN